MTPPRPYFDNTAVVPHGRILVISWHFPPSQAAGALRWQKFSRYAVERGFGVDVIAVSPDAVKDPDPARLEDLPKGVRVFGLSPAEPTLNSRHAGGRPTAHPPTKVS